ncbi:MAG: hypothetical protein ACYTBJ_19385 [Planctomycetota bacterium]
MDEPGNTGHHTYIDGEEMPDYKMETRDIQKLDRGLTVMLREDLDLLFSLDLVTVQEAIAPTIRATDKALKRHDEKYRAEDRDGNPIPLKIAGQVVGNKVREGAEEEASEEMDKIMSREVGFTSQQISLKALIDAQERDFIPVPGWVVGAFRPLLNTDGLDLKKPREAKKEDEKGNDKPRGRAASKKAEAEAEE